ncbi:hypothetical protein AX15_004179 [Amanita polypyramis BW_CC]|nr:hypothetical protein AX15_004179 [Amanita polypyramis BW_CC]
MNLQRTFNSLMPSNDSDWATIPSEIIHEILSWYTPGLVLSVRHSRAFPWYLGHICRAWRSVFVSSPQFWGHFSFEVLGAEARISIERLERALALVELCIKRTEGHPFSFKFDVSDVYNSENITMTALWLYCSQIMETLLAYSSRWRDVYITMDRDKLNELFKTRRHWHFTHLRRLQIRHPFSFSNRWPCFLPVGLLDNAPNLKHAYIDQYFKLNWSNVSVLHVELGKLYISVRSLTEALSMTTRLEVLVIRGHADFSELVCTPVKLPFLKVFSVNQDKHVLFVDVPALEELYITCHMRMPISAVVDFLGHVNHLKCLSLALQDRSSVTSILQLTPKVERLILIGDFSFHTLKHLECHMISRSLKELTVVVRSRYPSKPNPRDLADIIKTWDKQRFRDLHLLRVYIHPPEIDASRAVDSLKRWCREHDVKLVVEFSGLYTSRLGFYEYRGTFHSTCADVHVASF